MDLSQLDQQKKVALVGAAGVVGLGALAYLAKGGKRTNWELPKEKVSEYFTACVKNEPYKREVPLYTQFEDTILWISRWFQIPYPELELQDGTRITTTQQLKSLVKEHEILVAHAPGTASVLIPVPCGPTPKPIIGNLLDFPFGLTNLPAGFWEWAQKYGPVFRANIFGNPITVIADAKLVYEMTQNPDAFGKMHKSGILHLLRDLAGKGLFTALDNEAEWGVAHRILIPAFSLKSIQKYFPEMSQVARRLLGRLDEFGDNKEVPIGTYMTKLTFDTIGICGFNYDFHGVDSDTEGDFIKAMFYVLGDTLLRRTKPWSALQFIQNRKYKKACDMMMSTVAEVVRARAQETPEELAKHGDLLSLMLTAQDPQTSLKLTEQEMAWQIITFLIAGHETTSNLLSWALYLLSQNPEVERKAQDEVDSILSSDRNEMPTEKQIGKLKYIHAILKETLRIKAPIPMWARQVKVDGARLGNYALAKDEGIICLNYGLHKNPLYYPDANTFEPERWYPENSKDRHPGSFMAFAAGPRSCIGMQFALLEAAIVLAYIVKFKHIRLCPGREVHDQVLLTLRPENLFMRFVNRNTHEAAAAPKAGAPAAGAKAAAQGIASSTRVSENAHPLLFAYGSNTGTCQEVAQQYAQSAQRNGFKIDGVIGLDDLIPHLTNTSKHVCVIIVTATFNGTPPDNAKTFNQFLDTHTESLSHVKFAVFGVGNSQWAQTFQAFPNKIDAKFTELKASRIAPKGTVDVNDPSTLEDASVEFYSAVALSLITEFGSAEGGSHANHSLQTILETVVIDNIDPAVAAAVSGPSPGNGARLINVGKIQQLQAAASGRKTYHVELDLPKDWSYETGDHLGVYPTNHPELVKRACARLNLKPDQTVLVKVRDQSKKCQPTVPVNQLIRVDTLLTHWIDLKTVPSRANCELLATYATKADQKAKLCSFSASDGAAIYKTEISSHWKSILDVLDEYSSVQASLELLIDVCTRLQPRFYSISSSSSRDPNSAHLTVGLVDEEIPNLKGKKYEGTASGAVARLQEGQKTFVFVSPVTIPFRLPKDPSTPIMMVCAGTGLAPFRGFLHERKFQIDSRRKSNPDYRGGNAFLVFGCRCAEHDYIYREELEALKQEGVLTDIVCAFSRSSTAPKSYVQHQIWEHRDLVWKHLSEEGLFFVCGSAKGMAKEVKETLVQVAAEVGKVSDATEYVQQLLSKHQYLEDVWG